MFTIVLLINKNFDDIKIIDGITITTKFNILSFLFFAFSLDTVPNKSPIAIENIIKDNIFKIVYFESFVAPNTKFSLLLINSSNIVTA